VRYEIKSYKREFDSIYRFFPAKAETPMPIKALVPNSVDINEKFDSTLFITGFTDKSFTESLLYILFLDGHFERMILLNMNVIR
jgi:hypothetical protein